MQSSTSYRLARNVAARTDKYGKPAQLIQLHRVDHDSIGTALGSKCSQELRISRVLKILNELPQEPTSLFFDLDADFMQVYGESIVLADWRDETKNARIIIFTTSQLLAALCNSSLWIADGTFKCASKPFYQVKCIEDDINRITEGQAPKKRTRKAVRNSDVYGGQGRIYSLRLSLCFIGSFVRSEFHVILLK